MSRLLLWPPTAASRRPRHRRRLAAFACLAIAALPAIAGCGGDASGPETTQQGAANETPTVKRPRDALVTATEIRAASRTSPDRTLLIWWQGLQFGDASTVTGQYATRPPNLAEKLRKVAPSLSATKPVVQERQIEGNRARLLVILQSYQFNEGKVFTTEAPVTMRFTRIGKRWKLADDRFLNSRLEAQRAAETPPAG